MQIRSNAYIDPFLQICISLSKSAFFSGFKDCILFYYYQIVIYKYKYWLSTVFLIINFLNKWLTVKYSK